MDFILRELRRKVRSWFAFYEQPRVREYMPARHVFEEILFRSNRRGSSIYAYKHTLSLSFPLSHMIYDEFSVWTH